MFDSEEKMQEKILSLEKQLKEKVLENNFLKSEMSEVNFRLEKLVEQSKHELNILRKIQGALVPTEFPNISGFEFSTKFIPSAIKGGDYFDIFDLPEKMKFGMVMSCSSGYGMSALLMSVLMKFSGFHLIKSNEEVCSIVENIRNELIEQLSDIDQASLFWGMMNRRTHKLEFCLLGKITVLYYDYGSGEIEVIAPKNSLIQKDNVEDIESYEISLNPRDRMIVMSEGVFETQNLEGETISLNELLPQLKKVMRSPVHELRNEVLFQADRFASGAEAKRDRTVIALEVKDRVIKLAKS